MVVPAAALQWCLGLLGALALGLVILALLQVAAEKAESRRVACAVGAFVVESRDRRIAAGELDADRAASFAALIAVMARSCPEIEPPN